MSVSDISNLGMKFKLSGREYIIKRLSLMDLFGEFEAEVKKNYMDDIIALASRIADVKERIQFQRESIKDIPKGKALEDAVKEAMDGFEGGIKLLYLSLVKSNKITLDETKQLVMDNENQEVITAIMNFITGADQEAKEEKNIPANAIVIETEKKTVT